MRGRPGSPHRGRRHPADEAARFDEHVTLEELDFTVSTKLPVAAICNPASPSCCMARSEPAGKSHIARRTAKGKTSCRAIPYVKRYIAPRSTS